MSKFSPATQNVVVNAKQNQSQVMHTADVLYFNVIHTDQLLHGQLSTISRSSTWTLDKGLGGGMVSTTHLEEFHALYSRLKLVTFEVAGWLILREKYFVSKGGGSCGGGGGSNGSRRGPS